MSKKIDTDTCINLSLGFIQSYLKKDMGFMRVHIDPRTFFIGPRNGQIMRNGTDLQNAWLTDHPMPDFSVTDIEVSAVPTSSLSCEVLLHYNVTYHKDDGTTMAHPQNMQISWFIRQTVDGTKEDSDEHEHYKVAVMHISNPEEMDERDLVYNTFGDISTSAISRPVAQADRNEQWIMIPGVNAVLNRFPSGSILWIDSADQGHKSLVHTRQSAIRCTKPLSWFMTEYPGIFLQPSASFLVNPLFIKTVQRFTIELWNGHILHIPQKKYSAFKKSYLEFFNI